MKTYFHCVVALTFILWQWGGLSESSWAQQNTAAATDLSNLKSLASAAAAQCPQQSASSTQAATYPPAQGCYYMSGEKLVTSVPFDKSCGGKIPVTEYYTQACVAYTICNNSEQGASICPMVNGQCPTDANTCANDTTLDPDNSAWSNQQLLAQLCLNQVGNGVQKISGCNLPVSVGGSSSNGSGSTSGSGQ